MQGSDPPLGRKRGGGGQIGTTQQGRGCGGVSDIGSKALSFRKGRDDGDGRLGWRGNSGTSRHQPLLSVATHILFLSTTLSWGQCPSWRGQGVIPERFAREGHGERLVQSP